jgi:ABC-type phosphate transport system auxiliary subunit
MMMAQDRDDPKTSTALDRVVDAMVENELAVLDDLGKYLAQKGVRGELVAAFQILLVESLARSSKSLSQKAEANIHNLIGLEWDSQGKQLVMQLKNGGLRHYSTLHDALEALAKS